MKSNEDDLMRDLVHELVNASPVPAPFPASAAESSRRGRPSARTALLGSTGLVVLALLAVVLTLARDTDESGQDVLVGAPSPKSEVLFADDGSRAIYRIDVGSGKVARVEVPGKNTAGSYTDMYRLIARRDGLVFPGADDGSLSYASPYKDLTDSRVVTAGSFLFPAADDENAVWVYREEPDFDIRKVDVSGKLLVPATSLPEDRSLYGAVNEGIVVRNGGGVFEIWDPSTGKMRSLDVPGPSEGEEQVDVVAVAGDTIAWTTFSCGPHALHLTNTRTGVDRAVELSSGQFKTVSGAFSPDGSLVAVNPLVVDCIDNSASGSRLHVVNTSTAKIDTTLQATDGFRMLGPLAWSSSLRSLFFAQTPDAEVSADAPPPVPDLYMYDLKKAKSTKINGPAEAFIGLVVEPPRR